MSALAPLILGWLLARGSRSGPSGPTIPPPSPPVKDGGAKQPPPPPPPSDEGPPAVEPVKEEQPPNAQAARFATVNKGEGPYYFVKRTSGPEYARKWKRLREFNPELRLNRAGDNFTVSTWRAGMRVRIPDGWPGGATVESVSGFDTV